MLLVWYMLPGRMYCTSTLSVPGMVSLLFVCILQINEALYCIITLCTNTDIKKSKFPVFPLKKAKNIAFLNNGFIAIIQWVQKVFHISLPKQLINSCAVKILLWVIKNWLSTWHFLTLIDIMCFALIASSKANDENLSLPKMVIIW